MSGSDSIRMEKVCYTVGGRTILKDFDFCLERGSTARSWE